MDYDIVDLTTDPNAIATVKKLGHLQAPITDEDHWKGFRPDKIEALAKSITATTR